MRPISFAVLTASSVIFATLSPRAGVIPVKWNQVAPSRSFFQSKSAAGTYFRYFEVFFITGLIYLVLTLVVTRAIRMLEKKLEGPDHYVICGSQSDPAAEIHVHEQEDESWKR